MTEKYSPETVSRKEAAELIGTSPGKVNQLIRLKEIRVNPNSRQKSVLLESLNNFRGKNAARIADLKNTVIRLDHLGLSLELIQIVVSNALKGSIPILIGQQTAREFMFHTLYEKYKEEKANGHD